MEIRKLDPSEFPTLLSEIPQPPKQLYAVGNLAWLSHPKNKLLAVVGSRACSEYGRRVTKYLIQTLAGYPVTIVSGLALGIDGAAHKAALESGLPTISIPGSGLSEKVLYPRSHVSLAKEIVEKGGTLISELDPDQRPYDFSFPQRNRIMAGMSHATLVIEAKEKSGSLITARLAVEYNRDLLAVPGDIFSSHAAGSHQFLKLGAKPVTSAKDILDCLDIRVDEKEIEATLSDDEAIVFAALTDPVPRDELLRELKMPISEAQVLLSMMEIKGLITETLGVVMRT